MCQTVLVLSLKQLPNILAVMCQTVLVLSLNTNNCPISWLCLGRLQTISP